MNLLGHYACAAPFAPTVRLGSVLPDLLSLYGRKVRPLPLARLWEGDAGRLPGAQGLLEGIAFHHRVDVHFHRAPLFEGCAAALRARLREASATPGLKRFLPAHVLSELFFDHLLIRQEASLPRRFTAALAEGLPLLEAFVARHPAVQAGAFHGYMRRIASERFWEDYRSHEGICQRMNRILVRFGQRRLEPVETQAVSACFSERAQATFGELSAFVRAMQGRHGRPGSAPTLVAGGPSVQAGRVAALHTAWELPP